MKHAIVLSKVAQKAKKRGDAPKGTQEEWLAVIVEDQEQYKRPIEYEEDEDYETLKKRGEEAVEKLQAGSGQWRRRGGATDKVEGFEMGYHYEYARLTTGDVVAVYKNELQVDQKFVLTND